jgi:hypothetical protein
MINIDKIRYGMTREHIQALFGEPPLMGCKSRKYPHYKLWKYGEIEIVFNDSPYKADGRACEIYVRDGDKQCASLKEVIKIEASGLVRKTIINETIDAT